MFNSFLLFFLVINYLELVIPFGFFFLSYYYSIFLLELYNFFLQFGVVFCFISVFLFFFCSFIFKVFHLSFKTFHSNNHHHQATFVLCSYLISFFYLQQYFFPFSAFQLIASFRQVKRSSNCMGERI